MTIVIWLHHEIRLLILFTIHKFIISIHIYSFFIFCSFVIIVWVHLEMLKLNWIVWMSNEIAFTFGNDANTCCLTSQTRRSDGNCSDLKTFNSGTCTRTKSHPSRGSGGGSSSKPSPPAKIGDWSIFYLLILLFPRFSHFLRRWFEFFCSDI